MPLRVIWNALLLAVGLITASFVLPDVARQLLDVPWDASPSFVAWCLAIGLSGLGMLVLVLLGLGSFVSLTTNRVPAWYRRIYLAGIPFVLFGAACLSAMGSWETGHTDLLEYLGYLLVYAVIAFPIVVWHTGYLGLARRAWQRHRRPTS